MTVARAFHRKGQRTCLAGMPCAIARALDVIGDWWSLLIIRDALSGRRRFGEFQRHLGLAKNILTARLRKLVDAGILQKVPASDGSAYQEYVLTPKGEQLHVVVMALWQWGEAFCFAPGELGTGMVDRTTGDPIEKLALKTRSGRVVGPRDYTTAPARRAARRHAR